VEPAICAAIDYAIPFAQILPLIREAGFGVISLGARPEHSGYHTAEGRSRIRQLAGDNGLRIDSVHAPFPEGDRLCSLDEAERLESLRQCQTAVDAAQDLAVGIVVVHLNASPDAAVLRGMMDQGVRSMEALSAYALARGVRVAVENSWGEPYAMMLDHIMAELDAGPVGFCYDSGHENVNRAGFRDLSRYGHRLLTLHLHDNRGDDAHTLPYEGDTDWPRLMGLLHGFDYSGSLLLEACLANSAFRDPPLFLAEARKRAARLLGRA
jgi:sugar phosphate isomerase/epimerase